MVVFWAFAGNLIFALRLHRKLQNRAMEARREGQEEVKRSLIAATILIACSWAWAEQLNTTCSFERAIEYRISDGELYADQLSQRGAIPVMTIANRVTLEEASDADGQNLATLSVIWTPGGDEEDICGAWAGDFGELLTIQSTNESMGRYTATLQPSNIACANNYV